MAALKGKKAVTLCNARGNLVMLKQFVPVYVGRLWRPLMMVSVFLGLSVASLSLPGVPMAMAEGLTPLSALQPEVGELGSETPAVESSESLFQQTPVHDLEQPQEHVSQHNNVDEPLAKTSYPPSSIYETAFDPFELKEKTTSEPTNFHSSAAPQTVSDVPAQPVSDVVILQPKTVSKKIIDETVAEPHAEATIDTAAVDHPLMVPRQNEMTQPVVSVIPPMLKTPMVQETPTNLTEGDEGKVLPVSLIRGHVSRQAVQYILGPGDRLSIKVQDLDKFNQDFIVRPDGFATIHPFGEVRLAGTDVQGLQDWLNEQFKFYLLTPNVTVNVEEMRPALIYVTGAVNKPGTYQFLRQGLGNSNVLGPRFEKVEITLTNILSKTGGVSENADIENIRVVHASTGIEERFNLKAFLETGVAEDIWMLPGDSVIVPTLNHAMDPDAFKLVSRSSYFKDKFPVLVLGAVNQQGEVQVDPSDNSLNAAVALAGGFVKNLAQEDSITVQRPMPNGRFSTWEVDRHKNNLALLPGDVLYVGKNKFSHAERVMDFVVRISQPFFFGAGGAQFIGAVGN